MDVGGSDNSTVAVTVITAVAKKAIQVCTAESHRKGCCADDISARRLDSSPGVPRGGGQCVKTSRYRFPNVARRPLLEGSDFGDMFSMIYCWLREKCEIVHIIPRNRRH